MSLASPEQDLSYFGLAYVWMMRGVGLSLLSGVGAARVGHDRSSMETPLWSENIGEGNLV